MMLLFLVLFVLSPIEAQFGFDGPPPFGPPPFGPPPFGMHRHRHRFGGPPFGPRGFGRGPMGPMRGPMRGPMGPMGPMAAMEGGPMGPMGPMGGPPMGRPPWMFRPPPPFFRRGPRPFMGDGPPPPDFDAPMGPPMRPPMGDMGGDGPMMQPEFDAPQSQEPMMPEEPQFQEPPQQPPLQQPSFQPAQRPAPRLPTTGRRDSLNSNLRALVNHANYFNTAFRGQSYENVIYALHRYYTQRAGYQFNQNSIISTGASHNEIRANTRVMNGLFEADMMLTLNQLNQIISNRWKRKVTSDTSKRWTAAISYKFQENDGRWQGMIRSALKLYETNTCIRFYENGGGSDSLIFTKGDGCFSGVGKLGGQQEISLGSGCETVGIASHEIGHSLGLYHEQSRPERDAYVRINYQNIMSGYAGMFDKRSPSLSSSLGIPYDYGSVMHYAINSFSKNFGSDTINPFKSQYSATIGNRVEPAFFDYKAVNVLYCSGRCGRALPCQHEGYTNPNTCSTCICPTGLGGAYCDQVAYSSCGQDLTADSTLRTLSHSGTGTCYWRIKSANQGRIRLYITSIRYTCAVACEEFVEIKYLSSLAVTGARMCCQPTATQILSDSSTVIIISRSNQYSQFVIQYRNEGGASQQRTPPRQPTPVAGFGQWSAWGGWSGCTEKCGACGTRQRRRTCFSGRCSGSSIETQTCNMNACRRGTTLSTGRRGKRSSSQYFLNQVLRVKRNTEWWCCERYLARGTVCVHV